VFAARWPVAQLLGLDERADAAAWARFGLHTPQALLPCHPCTREDWQGWLLQQLPGARQLRMQALRDDGGRATGLWRMTLQGASDGAQTRHDLMCRALRAFWPERNLGEDLDGLPQVLRSRWVELEVSLVVEGRRDLSDLLAEVLQRCDDCISARLPEGVPPAGEVEPGAEGPLGRRLTEAEALWQDQDPDFLFVSDLARHLQDVPGLAAVDRLRLTVAHGEAPDPLDDAPTPSGAVRRRGPDWALRLRWPEHEAQLHRWNVARAGGPVQVPAQALLQLLSDRRRMPLRLASSLAVEVPAAARADALPALPAPRRDRDAASAALPPLYREAITDHARRQPGLAAQWQGYLALLEHGLNQVQVQREQLPRLYALDEEDVRSCWPALPAEGQLPGIEALYRRSREELESAAWIDEDKLSRRHRVLNYQLALHGEALDHADLQSLPCYFTPAAWPLHLLRLKRRFARRLLRLGRRRGTGADISRPLPGHEDNTPPLQERLALKLGLAQTHSRWLSRSWQSQGLPAPDEEAASAGDVNDARFALQAPAAAQWLLDPTARRRATAWAKLRRSLPTLRDTLPAPLLRAAVRPELFQWSPTSGGRLWLGPDERGRHWSLADGLDEAAARDHAQALHEAACELQAAGEGMHLVEHVLLRPLAGTGGAGADPIQVSLVCSGWTARGADPRFRNLAAQTLAREAPAHLHCRLLWLDAPGMLAFEQLWQRWLSARLAHCEAVLAGPGTPAQAEALAQVDRQAAALRALLGGLGT